MAHKLSQQHVCSHCYESMYRALIPHFDQIVFLLVDAVQGPAKPQQVVQHMAQSPAIASQAMPEQV